jgi:hypothetical protein
MGVINRLDMELYKQKESIERRNVFLFEWNAKDVSVTENGIIPTDSECPACSYMIQKVNETDEQDNTPRSDSGEPCITHPQEAIHASLMWRLSK